MASSPVSPAAQLARLPPRPPSLAGCPNPSALTSPRAQQCVAQAQTAVNHHQHQPASADFDVDSDGDSGYDTDEAELDAARQAILQLLVQPAAPGDEAAAGSLINIKATTAQPAPSSPSRTVCQDESTAHTSTPAAPCATPSTPATGFQPSTPATGLQPSAPATGLQRSCSSRQAAAPPLSSTFTPRLMLSRQFSLQSSPRTSLQGRANSSSGVALLPSLQEQLHSGTAAMCGKHCGYVSLSVRQLSGSWGAGVGAQLPSYARPTASRTASVGVLSQDPEPLRPGGARRVSGSGEAAGRVSVSSAGKLPGSRRASDSGGQPG